MAKKRIKSWDEVFGHQNIINYLKNKVASDSIGDVIILHGNSGIGKTAMAKLLAIDIATRFNPELRERYIEAVIENNESTDSIKLFNMSEIQEKDEEIQRMKGELNLAFSTTGRKVHIWDEAHGMRWGAQDSVLTELEHLPKGVYVIICTTELGALRPALQSRCSVPLKINDISEVEAKKLCASEIARRRLTFAYRDEMVIANVCNYTNNQPRKICNLFENFEEGSHVSAKDLELFLNTTAPSAIIEVVKYLYGSLTLGMDYLMSMKIDESFVTTLLEITKVALGHVSRSISPQDTAFLKDFMSRQDPMHLIQFTAEIAGLTDLRKRRVVSAFMRAHVSYKRGLRPAEIDSKLSRAQDLATLTENVQVTLPVNMNKKVTAVPTIEEMFGSADIAEFQTVPSMEEMMRNAPAITEEEIPDISKELEELQRIDSSGIDSWMHNDSN